MVTMYNIYNLHCSGCAIRIEEQIKLLPDVEDVSVDLITNRLTIEGGSPDLKELNTLVGSIVPGVWFEPFSFDHVEEEDLLPTVFLWISGILFSIGLLYQEKLYHQLSPIIINLVFFGIPYLICGWSVLQKGLECLLLKDFFNEFTLMGGATIVAIILGEFPEAVGVMFFYRIGEYVQDRVAIRSRKSIKALLATKPSIAHLVEGEYIQDISPELLQPGAKLLVKPGEKIPVDGIVESGESQIDTSPLTGESVPISAAIGSTVFGGTINLSGSLTVKATACYEDSSVSKILELVESAIARKAPTERFITRFSRYYTPIVVLGAIVVGLVPPIIGFGTFKEWIYRGLVLMVISCPCALLISIPLGYLGGIGAASRRGILVKGGNVLDALKKIKVVAFDKTGTLTKATFTVTQVLPSEGVSIEQVLQIAAIAESYSAHPIVFAILEAARMTDKLEVVEIQEIPGKGLIAIHHGDNIFVGSKDFLISYGFTPATIDSPGSVVYVAKNNSYLGAIVVSDTVKPDAAEAILQLKHYVSRVIMLTGDRVESAEYVAECLNIDEYRAALLPEDKAAVIESFGPSEQVLFVGDGINDAPVLALSGVGIAMGGLGSEAAIEVADAVILDDSPVRVADLIRIAHRTHHIVLQNIILALGVKIIVMYFGIAGLSTLWEAVFADVGVTLLAVLNASRAGICSSS